LQEKSELDKIKDQRKAIGINIFPIAEVSASCKLCNVRYISRENSTILFCPSCGNQRLVKDTKHSDFKIRALYGQTKTQPFIVSYDPRSRAKKKHQDEDIKKEIGYYGCGPVFSTFRAYHVLTTQH